MVVREGKGSHPPGKGQGCLPLDGLKGQKDTIPEELLNFGIGSEKNGPDICMG